MNDPTLFRDLRELLAVVERTSLAPVRQRAELLRYRLDALVPSENDGGGE